MENEIGVVYTDGDVLGDGEYVLNYRGVNYIITEEEIKRYSNIIIPALEIIVNRLNLIENVLDIDEVIH